MGVGEARTLPGDQDVAIQRRLQAARDGGAVDRADHLPLPQITWFEPAWLAEHERIQLTIPIRSWLQQLAGHVRTVGNTSAVAAAAVSLPSSFPGDPADRLIYATAVEHGWRLVNKDRRLRSHRHPRPVAVR